MRTVNKKININNLKPRHFSWILGTILLIILTFKIFLFWLNIINLVSLIISALGLVVVELLFILGVRLVQRDAFINGFRNGRNGVKKAKKKS